MIASNPNPIAIRDAETWIVRKGVGNESRDAKAQHSLTDRKSEISDQLRRRRKGGNNNNNYQAVVPTRTATQHCLRGLPSKLSAEVEQWAMKSAGVRNRHAGGQGVERRREQCST